MSVLKRSLVVASLFLAACHETSSDDAAGEELASSQGDALTQSDAARALFVGPSPSPLRRFHSDHYPDHCGATLELIHGEGFELGLATYTYRDCDDSSVPPIVYHGKYDVVSGWLDGHLTDPTLRIDAIPAGATSHVRWRYAIRSSTSADGATAIRLEMFEDFGSFGIPVYGTTDIWLHPIP